MDSENSDDRDAIYSVVVMQCSQLCHLWSLSQENPSERERTGHHLFSASKVSKCYRPWPQSSFAMPSAQHCYSVGMAWFLARSFRWSLSFAHFTLSNIRLIQPHRRSQFSNIGTADDTESWSIWSPYKICSQEIEYRYCRHVHGWKTPAIPCPPCTNFHKSTEDSLPLRNWVGSPSQNQPESRGEPSSTKQYQESLRISVTSSRVL